MRNILRAFNTQNTVRLVILLPSHILLMTNLKHRDISVLPKVIWLVNGKLRFKSKLLDSGVQALNFSMLYFFIRIFFHFYNNPVKNKAQSYNLYLKGEENQVCVHAC